MNSRLQRRRNRDKKENRGFLAITVIVCGILIYALYTSSAGKWIMDNYIEPVFTEEKQKESNGKNKEESRQISFDGFTLYALQTGAFNSKENADKSAEELNKAGRGGYVYKDDKYRVLAYAYIGEKEAKTANEKLSAVANIETGIYEIKVPNMDFKVTGEEKNLNAVDGAFKAYISGKDKVFELVEKLDKGEINKDDAVKDVRKLEGEFKDKLKGIDKLANSDEKLGEFRNVYKDIIGRMEGVKEGDGAVVSSGLKTLYMDMVCRYGEFVKKAMAS